MAAGSSGVFSSLTSYDKEYIERFFRTNEITNDDCIRTMHAHWGHRPRVWGGKAGTIGFAFSAKAWNDSTVRKFIDICLRIVYNVKSCCDTATMWTEGDWRNTGLDQSGIDFSKVGGGFWMDFNAKSYDNWKPALSVDEALEWIFRCARGERIPLEKYLDKRKRRDGKYACGSAMRAILHGEKFSWD